VKGERLEAGGWRLEAGGWKIKLTSDIRHPASCIRKSI